jgi:hypothetical protein
MGGAREGKDREDGNVAVNVGSRGTGSLGTWGLVAAGAALALGYGVRLWDLAEQSLWTDEAFSVWLASQGPGAIYSRAVTDIHGPLYY